MCGFLNDRKIKKIPLEFEGEDRKVICFLLKTRKFEKICCPILTSNVSGSPIIQSGKIVGAVTHVLVNDPTRGYGIFIENMLDAAA